ncbi:MAG: DUF559 domain-containing protein [Caulobacterales bacterium]|nr:DUF559 domain-containing protein [Caulobacterales bacterium]
MEIRSTLTQARLLRRRMTRTEITLWQTLRGKQLEGLKFRRQQVIGPYVVDFFCAASRLVVELDGGAHADEDAQAHDARRDQWIAAQGLRILRIPNGLVIDDLASALALIVQAARPNARIRQVG